ncbi:MAG TPA: hypothetical protein VIF12_06185 [Micavibrio sp.]|jgi:hypothetical protein
MIYKDALSSWRLKLRAAFQGKPASEEQIDSHVIDLLDRHHGLAFGEYHGVYSHPLFIARNAARFAEHGVTVAYIEILPANRQGLLYKWQYENNPKPLIDFMNKRTHAHSTGQWQHYWEMLQALNRAGVRIVAADTRPDKNNPIGPTYADRNDNFVERIVEDRKNLLPGDKILVYGGRDHICYYTNGQYGISNRLGIPGILMETGSPQIVDATAARNEHVIFLPHAAHQVTHFRGPQVRHHKIDYPGS